MASHGDVAEGGTNEEFNDIIKWRSGQQVKTVRQPRAGVWEVVHVFQHVKLFRMLAMDQGQRGKRFSEKGDAGVCKNNKKYLLSIMNISKWMSWRKRNFFRRKRKPENSDLDEHDAVQKKTFTKWINAQFSKTGKEPIKDMFSDLRDGRKLLDLLEGLTGTVLTKERGSTRVHALNNVNKVLQVLHQNNPWKNMTCTFNMSIKRYLKSRGARESILTRNNLAHDVDSPDRKALQPIIETTQNIIGTHPYQCNSDIGDVPVQRL
ncbi:Utrophin Dystrophin-related protein 1 [Collichthys lucidus]|uniref:Utrophin Dystrophin-related protein 1 n=1 Tax=Collichthys lucidus TaxID=240159 RepID=A0A4U5UMI4_COLLU|nr:Utrophin Dystrophin-related protein 1 [Collichthys lucidus]